jgi:hypothetical protein
MRAAHRQTRRTIRVTRKVQYHAQCKPQLPHALELVDQAKDRAKVVAQHKLGADLGCAQTSATGNAS